jgi:hypothetical protein
MYGFEKGGEVSESLGAKVGASSHPEPIVPILPTNRPPNLRTFRLLVIRRFI